MPCACTPANENARLEALRSYDILDTGAEVAFDDLAELAADICDTPIALVSLVDECRQWFKARKGLDATETTRDLAFCAHAILNPDRLLVVPDAREDSRFSDNPLVTGEPHIRFYAGAPIVSPGGMALGTLCTIDQRPRDLSNAQKKQLLRLANQVVRLLEYRRVSRALAGVIREMETVKEILVPICSNCKGIRDDKGFWNRLEAFMAEHCDFRFSHGICPDCMIKLYPGYLDSVMVQMEKEEGCISNPKSCGCD